MQVTFVTAILTHYRVPFHELVRAKLAASGVEYRLVYGQPSGAEQAKADTAELAWGTRIENRELSLGRSTMLWQPILASARHTDLLVLGQENRLLANYLFQILPRRFRPKVALWGHGRNFQSDLDRNVRERWKRYWSTRCDWWFAYTEQSRSYVESSGFPRERITVFNNSIDTRLLLADLDSVGDDDIAEARRKFGVTGDSVGIYVGGLYEKKRLDFLVESAIRIRQMQPDFELVVVGSGSSAAALRQMTDGHDWIKVIGPQFGRDKATLLRMAKLFLMPGLLGLAVLDAFCASLPVVTTAYPYHSPEIAYLEDGVSGLIVKDWQDPAAYAAAVAALFGDSQRRDALARAARASADAFSIEAMADRFVGGSLSALKWP